MALAKISGSTLLCSSDSLLLVFLRLLFISSFEHFNSVQKLNTYTFSTYRRKLEKTFGLNLHSSPLCNNRPLRIVGPPSVLLKNNRSDQLLDSLRYLRREFTITSYLPFSSIFSFYQRQFKSEQCCRSKKCAVKNKFEKCLR